MKLTRAAFLPFLLIFALLFAQQAGAVHTLHHALEGQAHHGKQVPPSDTCEQCAAYAQLGSALNVGAYDFALPVVSGEAVQHAPTFFHSIPLLAATARGPPVLLQTIA